MTRAALALAALVVAAVVAGVAFKASSDDGEPGATAARSDANAASASAPSPSGPRFASVTATPAARPPAPPLTPASGVVDPRVPAIDPPSAEPPPAQPWEIADPALYKAREKRLTQEMNERFVQAADARLPPLLAAVDELRARDAPQADIDRAEDKIRHLQAVREALVKGEPLVRDGRAASPLLAASAAASR